MHPKIKKIVYDPLYKNTFFIILNSIVTAFFGIFFWIFAARFYSSEDVGLATALISSAAIIGSLSSFGLGIGMMRFLPENNDKSLLFNSVWIISLISLVVFGIIFLLGIDLFSPALKFLMTPWFMATFLLFMIFQMSSGLINIGLLALRKAEYSFTQNLVLGFRIILIIPLAFGGVMGIFGSLGIAFALSFLMGIFILHKHGITIKPVFNKNLIYDITHYSFANYIADFFQMAQMSILPIIILNVIGAKESAYFYVAFSIASLLYAIPKSIFMSMFIEGSYGGPLRKNIIKSLTLVGALVLPMGVLIYFFGDVLLFQFSKEYSQNSYEILKLLLLSVIFVTFNTMFITVKKIQKDVTPLIVVNMLLFVSTVLFSYILMWQYGIYGVGLGWMAGQGITAAMVGVMIWKERWF